MSHDAAMAQATRMQRAIAGIWQEVLRLDQVGVDEDFFELGGESLAAVQMLAAIEDLVLTQISFADFLESPTVASLAAAVERARAQPDRVAAPVLAHSEDGGTAPCTFAQERLWFVDQLTGSSSAYNEQVGARIRGPLDAAALERSLLEVVRRHDALRTSFTIEDGMPVQVIGTDVSVELERFDASGEDELRLLAEEIADTTFDLGAAPLMRAALIRVAGDDHVLELVFHHNITDGLSHVVVLRELATLYKAHAAGAEYRLPAPPLQYPDYARWERERLQGQALEDAVAPWRERLADIPTALDLPTDHPRPPVLGNRGKTHRVRLDSGTTEEILAFSHAEGVTPFVTMLAAFDILLARYSGQETIVVGSATAGRDRPELADAVGLFANTVVLRTDVSGDLTFRELLGRVRHTVLDALAHEDAPFERLVAELQLEPDLSRHPIFQVMLVFRPHAALELDGADPYYAPTRSARSDLTLWVEDAPGGYELVWEYNTDLFEAGTIERFERHYLRLLRAGLAQPHERVGQLPLLSEQEREELLVGWNHTAAPYPHHCLHELLAEQAAATPDRVAVVCEGERLTYAELDARADRVASCLRGLGVGPDVLVGVAVDRSLEMLVGLLGVLKAGGAYVPVDPAYPAERVSFMLENSGAPVVLTQERLVDTLPLEGRTVVCLDRDLPSGSHESAPIVAVSPEHLAYVIYTSGSTGEPKGVQIPHRAIVNFLVTMADTPGLGADDVLVAVTTLSFDIAGLELWLPLLVGARVVIASGETPSDPRALAKLLADCGATVMQATPTTWRMLLDSGWTAPGGIKALCGGEPLSVALADRLVALGIELWNMYGPTETTVWSTCAWIDTRGKTLTIGRPIANTTIYILDKHLEPVPVGVAGELWIGGDGLARGYRGRDDLTAERFVTHEFDPTHHERIYRTGDLSRYRPDGEIEFLGRIDNQVKVRGFRIELGEIETTLTRHPAVAEAVVVARGSAGEAELAAYVVPDTDVAPPLALRDELRSHLERTLPAYMIPSSITIMDEFPLTNNGKVDRRALPAPERGSERETEFEPPATPFEQQIAAIWQDVLAIERVGAADNFFRLGGHSLLAARVVAQVRERFEVELGIRPLFERPTLRSFADYVASLGATSASAPETVLDSPPEDDAPLSFQQQALLFFDALDPGSTVYNAPLATRIVGPLDASALERALRLLVERHEALRTVVAADGAQPQQVVLDDAHVELSVNDVTASDLSRLMVESARRPFDLARDLLLRATLFRLGSTEHVLLLESHHIVLDAWAVQILARDLGELYEAVLAGRAPALPGLGMSYREFARRQRRRLSGEVLERELDFWRTHLAGAPPMLKLPTDRRRPAEQTFEGAMHRFELAAPLTEAVRLACEQHEVTPYMLLMATFTTLLYRVSGESDIVLGGPMINRDHPDLENLLGFCANTVLVRVRLGGNPTFAELAARVRDSVLASFEHQEVPLELVVEAVKPERIPGVNPLFQVNFRVMVGSLPAVPLADADTSLIPVDLGHARFDLALELHMLDDRIEAEFGYNTNLFDRATIERLAADFERLLHEALADPGRRLLSFDVAAAASPDAKPAVGARGIRGLRERRAAGR